MTKKPLFYDGMSWIERARSIFVVIIIFTGFAAFLFGGYVYVWATDSSSERPQHQSESDSEYHERLSGEDEEQYKDCGFRPAC